MLQNELYTHQALVAVQFPTGYSHMCVHLYEKILKRNLYAMVRFIYMWQYFTHIHAYNEQSN